MDEFVKENYNFDYTHKNIQDHLTKIDDSFSMLSDKEFAIKAYNYVRDTWGYYPYKFSLRNEDWRASEIIKNANGHCLDKSVLLISFLRAKSIPSRLGLAKVKNHIAVDQIVEKFESDVLVPHGYVDIFLNNTWIKATPAFNTALCKMLNVDVLEFNGEDDSQFQEFDRSGEEIFMEYLEDYGTFNEVPLPFMIELIRKHYPPIHKKNVKLGDVLDLANL